MAFLYKLYNHIKNFTLLDRVKYQFSDIRKWDLMKSSNQDYCFYQLEKCIKIKLYSDSYLSYLILRGTFENDEIRFVKKILNEKFIFFDIGANVGLFSLIAARRVRVVYSFEPTPKVYERLKENIKLNDFKNIFPHNLALSNKQGVSSLHLNEDSSLDAWNKLSSSNDINKSNITIDVKTVRLDDFLREQSIKLSEDIFIKIDVEGWEKYVLEGAKNLLKEGNPIFLIEFNDDNFNQNNYNGMYLIDYLEKFGFKFYEFSDKGIALHKTKQVYSYTNLIATKENQLLKKYIL
ncbi:MAG: FkbM family methyltransferase [Vicingaceae bacterium]|nr:FkbM family methyltransferase [Vicingaceae bacterium]